jgi:hypothetical protein
VIFSASIFLFSIKVAAIVLRLKIEPPRYVNVDITTLPCYQPNVLQAISKKPFGPIFLLEAKFKSSQHLSMPPV